MARELVVAGRTRHGLFFAQLALEKTLKALVCRHTGDLAPRLHNLVRLAEIAGLQPTPSQRDALAELSVLNIEGRYPDAWLPPPGLEEADAYLTRAEELLEWLTRLF